MVAYAVILELTLKLVQITGQVPGVPSSAWAAKLAQALR